MESEFVSGAISISVRRWVAACAVTAVVLSPGYAVAQGPCAAATYGVSGNEAFARTFTAAMHYGCTGGVATGGAAFCARDTLQAVLVQYNAFTAFWASETARVADTMGGCVFMCTSGDCRVGHDGLPVELLQFGVE